tara:strand:- start:11075 stop:13585 length:2511 start_codon:yes stop_codon:yes gene_type:complete
MSESKKRIEEIKKALKSTELSQKDIIKLQKEYNDLLQEQIDKQRESYDISSSMVDAIKETLGINIRRTTASSNLLKINKSINNQILDQVKGSYEVNEINKQINSNAKLLEKAKVKILSLEQKVSEEGKERAKKVNSELGQIRAKEKLIQAELSKTKEQGGIDLSIVATLKQQIIQHDAAIDKTLSVMSASEKQLAFTMANRKALKEQNKERQKDLENAKKINKKLGIAGGLLKGISKIPIISDVVDANSALDDMREHIADGGSAVGGLAKGFKNLGTQIGAGLFNASNLVLGALTMMGQAIMSVDKQTGDFAKSMNLSYNEALAVRKELTEIGRTSASMTTFGFFGEDPALNTRALVETLGSVNKSLGTTGKLSEGDLKTFTKLREQTGMTNEQIMGMQKFTMVMGGDLDKNTVNFQAQAKALGMAKGISLNTKDLMADISNISSRTKLSIEGGADGLAKAAVNAKLMGSNMAQVEAIADSLLNFEQSIEKELSAELLLGKELNLEKARTAALNNDMATVAAEITKQAGSAEEFGNMNRIQQEAIASAIGMSADAMGDMLYEQEALKSIGQSLNEEEQRAFDLAKEKYGVEEASRMLKSEAQGEGLQGLLDQQSAQEEFNMAIEKAKEVFVTIAQEVLPAVKLAMTPILFIIQAISEGIQMFVKGLKDGNPLAIVLAGVLGAMAIPALISAVGAIITTFSMIPFGVGIPLGIAAIAGMYSMANKAKNVKDAAIDPKGGIVMQGEKGAIQLDKEDSVIAGTDLFGKKKEKSVQQSSPQSSPQPQGGTDMTAILNAINALAARPINVQVGEEVVVKAAVGNSPNITGDEMGKNSYQLN